MTRLLAECTYIVASKLKLTPLRQSETNISSEA